MKTSMSGFHLLSLNPKSILLCLLCEHEGRLCKYVFASWHDIKPCQLEGWVGTGAGRNCFSLPGSSVPCWSAASCSTQLYAVPYCCRYIFSSASLLQGVTFSRMQPCRVLFLQSWLLEGGFPRSWSQQYGVTSSFPHYLL